MWKGLLYGIVAEWFKAADLKSVDGKTSVGSKPTYAAIWPVSQEVKMLPFHGGDMGSIPVGVTIYATLAQLVEQLTCNQ